MSKEVSCKKNKIPLRGPRDSMTNFEVRRVLRTPKVIHVASSVLLPEFFTGKGLGV